MATKETEPNIEKLNIFQRMAAITAELKTVSKNLDVKAGNGTYKAVSERDILDAVKPAEERWGIYSYPSDREILEAQILESESTYNDKTTTKSTFFTRIKTVYTFVNVDNPSESITTITFSEGIDSQDKGSGKAMTYADKYALMKAYKISTGDDPDQNGSEENNYRQRNGQDRSQNRNSSGGNQKNSAPQCSRCHNPITQTITSTGCVMEVEEVVDYSMRRFGVPLCTNCQKELLARHRAAQEAKAAAAASNPSDPGDDTTEADITVE